MTDRLSPRASEILSSMKNGAEVIVRATTGSADCDGFECTNALLELKKKGLVKVSKIDEKAGWVWYVPT